MHASNSREFKSYVRVNLKAVHSVMQETLAIFCFRLPTYLQKCSTIREAPLFAFIQKGMPETADMKRLVFTTCDGSYIIAKELQIELRAGHNVLPKRSSQTIFHLNNMSQVGTITVTSFQNKMGKYH